MGMSGTFTTIYDLVHGLDENEILAACAECDPEHASGYAPMLRELKSVKPKRVTMTVVIRPWAGEPGYYDVSGREMGDDELYGIAFNPWKEWLGSTFAVEGTDLMPARVLAECLNEMTWGGWSQQEAAANLEMIVGHVNELRDLIEDE
jgi:hypothetical protein